MIGTDFETFMRIGNDYIPVPPNINIGHKGGKQVVLEGGTMHRDNVMVELCPDPVPTCGLMPERVNYLVQQTEEYLSKLMGETIRLGFEPTVRFDMSDLNSPYAQEIGCDPDFQAHQGRGVKRGRITAEGLADIRCAGGHIHMSYNSSFLEPMTIHLADLAMGTLDALMGTQGRRREFYGQPGLYRPKNYGGGEHIRGVEYRTPSTRWLSSDLNMLKMARHAFNVEHMVRHEPTEKLLTFIKNHWPALIAQGTLMNENAEECTQFLRACRADFPDYDWYIGA